MSRYFQKTLHETYFIEQLPLLSQSVQFGYLRDLRMLLEERRNLRNESVEQARKVTDLEAVRK